MIFITHPWQPILLPACSFGRSGFIARGLELRRQAGVKPFTVLCCDNLPSNGKVIRRLVLEMAEHHDPQLAEWIASNGAFPCSMVDRIVPAATQETLDRAERLLGVTDSLAIDTEPFLQWVIEDRFTDGRPAWEAGGAIFADNVEPYEKMKLRLLNGSHTLLAISASCTVLIISETTWPCRNLRPGARAYGRGGADTRSVPGINLPAYIDELLERFSNPTIAHRNLQIALDTTQKLPQRLLSPAVDALARGEDGAATAYAVGVWMAAVAKRGDAMIRVARRCLRAASVMDSADPSASFFAIPGLFPQHLSKRGRGGTGQWGHSQFCVRSPASPFRRQAKRLDLSEPFETTGLLHAPYSHDRLRYRASAHSCSA